MPMMPKEPNKTMDAASIGNDQDTFATNRLGVSGLATSTTETTVQENGCGRFAVNDAGLHLAYAGILVAVMGILMQACSLPGTIPPGERPRSARTILFGVFLSLVGAGLTVTGLVALSI